MKNYNILSILFFACLTIISCKKDKEPITTDISGTHISVDDIKNYLPTHLLQKNASVVYKNSTGEEIVLQTTFTERTFNAEEQGKPYTYTQFFVRFSDTKNPNFSIELYGYGLYTSKFDVQKSIRAYLMPLNNGIGSIVSSEFKNGKALVRDIDTFMESVDGNGAVFNDVYIGKANDALAYSEIWLNSNEGITAFSDKNENLWTFVKFIN